jgi:hypothetical protein
MRSYFSKYIYILFIYFFLFFFGSEIYLETFHVWRALSHSFSTEGMAAGLWDLECA